jgi:hypothetical protein
LAHGASVLFSLVSTPAVGGEVLPFKVQGSRFKVQGSGAGSQPATFNLQPATDPGIALVAALPRCVFALKSNCIITAKPRLALAS